MDRSAIAGPSGSAKKERRLVVKFGVALGSLALLAALVGAVAGLSLGVAHRTYRLVVR